MTRRRLLPNTQFTVGPLTFRADYVYDGDPEVAPPAKFFEEEVGGRAGEEDSNLEFVAAEEEEAAKKKKKKKKKKGRGGSSGQSGTPTIKAFDAYFEEELAADEPVGLHAGRRARLMNRPDEEEAEPAMPPEKP